MQHSEILERIIEINIFFESIGLKKVSDLKETWDLDSYYKYQPINDNYIVNYRGENRVLINVEVGIVGGILFELSGKMGVSVYESIKTDYDFKSKYEDAQLFKNEFRNFKLNQLLNENN